MKILENKLDDYFTKQLIKEILYNIKIRFNLDTKVEYKKNKMGKEYTQVIISAKPRHYVNYTKIVDFVKGDAFNHLTYLKCAEKSFINEKIEKLNKEDLWVK